MGWKPNIPQNVNSIPLFYEFNQYQYHDPGPVHQLVFLGQRHKNSLKMHQTYSRQTRFDGLPSYQYKFPPRVVESNEGQNSEKVREFEGMNP